MNRSPLVNSNLWMRHEQVLIALRERQYRPRAALAGHSTNSNPNPTMVAEPQEEYLNTPNLSTTLSIRTRTIPVESFWGILQHLPAPRIAWSPPTGPSTIAAGSAATITTVGPDRFETAKTIATNILDKTSISRDIPPTARPRFFGGASFHPTISTDSHWQGFPPLFFILPRIQITHVDDTFHLTETDQLTDKAPDHFFSKNEITNLTSASFQCNRPPGLTSLQNNPNRDTWHNQVTNTLNKIRNGTFEKVVLARTLTASLAGPIDPVSIITAFETNHSTSYQFLIEPTASRSLFGSTPERLIARHGQTIETEALAGSIARGTTPTTDESLSTALKTNPKEQHEHQLVTDTIRNQLDPLTTHLTTTNQTINRLESVQHIKTVISGRLTSPTHILSLVDNLHPTPAVGGLPPTDAHTSIRQTETFDRGWYASPVGWFDHLGNGEFAVSIRSAVTTDSTATLFAGAGIVADSEPDDEWDEINLKWQPLLDALRQ